MAWTLIVYVPSGTLGKVNWPVESLSAPNWAPKITTFADKIPTPSSSETLPETVAASIAALTSCASRRNRQARITRILADRPGGGFMGYRGGLSGSRTDSEQDTDILPL